jgi:hypothetical protein
MDFVDMTPQEIIQIDLSKLSEDELRSLHYFVWAFYTDEIELQQWRQEKLAPLIVDLPVEAGYDDDFDDDEEY